MRAAPRFSLLVGTLAVATFALRWWSVSRWSWNSDDWIYLHDASVESFLPYVFQNYNGHFMPGQFAVVWVLNALAPLDHGVVVLVTATWAAALAALWAVALRSLWGTGPVTWLVLLVVTLSPLMVHSTMWWAAALQTLALQTCFAGCLFYAARILRTDGAQGAVGLLLCYVGGLLMWEKALLLVLPLAIVLVHGTPGALRVAIARRRRVLAWLLGLSVGYLALFLAAVRLSGPASANAVRADPTRSPADVAGFVHDLWAHLLAPGLFGGPWGTLPTPEDFDARPSAAVSILTLVALLGLLAWLLLRDRRAWLPVAGAVVYALAAWSTILFSSRFDIVSWHRLGYERYAVDALVVLAVLLGTAAAGRPADRRPGAAGLPRWVPVTAVAALALSLVASSTSAVLRFGVSPTRSWLAAVERGVTGGDDGGDGAGSMTLVDRYAPEEVMPPAFWGEQAKLSYLLRPWRDRVSFHGPAAELHVVDDEGRMAAASFAPAATSPPGPVPDCGYLVDGDGPPRTVEVAPELFDYEWVLKVDAFSGSGGTLVVRGEEELEVPIPKGLSSRLLVFVGPAGGFELEMAQPGTSACVAGLSVGTVEAAAG